MTYKAGTPFPSWDFADCTAAPLGLPMCQNRMAIPTWSFAMERRPPARLIELGTYSGGFITALAVHAWWIGATVTTFDLAAPHETVAKLGRFLGVNYETVDMWKAEADIARMIQGPGTTYLLCDGGDKPRELVTFARYLKPGDVIAAHDYDAAHEISSEIRPGERPWPFSEVRLADGQRAAAEHGLVPWMQDHFDVAGWLAYERPIR